MLNEQDIKVESLHKVLKEYGNSNAAHLIIKEAVKTATAEELNKKDENGVPLLWSVFERWSDKKGYRRPINLMSDNGVWRVNTGAENEDAFKWESLLNQMVQNGAKVNVTDKDGNSLLHYASAWMFAEGVKWLLNQEGVDVGHRNSVLQTPLDLAQISYETMQNQIGGTHTQMHHQAVINGADTMSVLTTALHNKRERELKSLSNNQLGLYMMAPWAYKELVDIGLFGSVIKRLNDNHKEMIYERMDNIYKNTTYLDYKKLCQGRGERQ